MNTLQSKIPKEFQDALPIFIFFIKEHIEIKPVDESPLLRKSKYYNTEKMFYVPYYKPSFLKHPK
jgi:hypothetical protein